MVDVEVRTLAPATTIAARLETTTDQLSSVFDAELPRVGARSAERLTDVAWPLVRAEGS